MTGKTRDYLADLANRKGVKLTGDQARGQRWASKTIDGLNKRDDIIFPEISDAQRARISSRIESIKEGIGQWTFAE